MLRGLLQKARLSWNKGFFQRSVRSERKKVCNKRSWRNGQKRKGRRGRCANEL